MSWISRLPFGAFPLSCSRVWLALSKNLEISKHEKTIPNFTVLHERVDPCWERKTVNFSFGDRGSKVIAEKLYSLNCSCVCFPSDFGTIYANLARRSQPFQVVQVVARISKREIRKKRVKASRQIYICEYLANTSPISVQTRKD